MLFGSILNRGLQGCIRYSALDAWGLQGCNVELLILHWFVIFGLFGMFQILLEGKRFYFMHAILRSDMIDGFRSIRKEVQGNQPMAMHTLHEICLKINQIANSSWCNGPNNQNSPKVLNYYSMCQPQTRTSLSWETLSWIYIDTVTFTIHIYSIPRLWCSILSYA